MHRKKGEVYYKNFWWVGEDAIEDDDPPSLGATARQAGAGTRTKGRNL